MSDSRNYWTRLRKPITRRRALASGALGGTGLLSIGLVGCGDDDDDDGGDPTATTPAGGNGSATASPSAAPGGPQVGGEITYARGAASTQTLDPHTSLSLAFFFTPFYTDRLVAANRQSIEPIEAETVESWEQVDDTTLTLTVRPGVTFHEGRRTNGRAFVAEDVAYNLMRIAGRFDPERIAQFQRSSTLANMDTAEAVDETTVRVTFSSPNSVFLNGMADGRNWIVAREDIEADPNYTDFGSHSGTGAFTIAEWDQGQQIGVYERNPNYWKEGLPYLERVRQVSLPDTAAQRSAFLTGDAMFSEAQLPEIRAEYEAEGFPLVSWEGLGWDYFRFNQNIAPLDNPQVRQALHLALDKAELSDATYGEGYWNYTGPLPSGFPDTWTDTEVAAMPGWNPDTRDADIAEARSLMDAAGFADGEIDLPILPVAAGGYNDMAIRAQDLLTRIWPDMNVTLGDPSNFARDLGGGAYTAVIYPSIPPPAAILEASLHYRSGGGRNYTDFADPDVDRLIDEVYLEFDGDARAELMTELQERLRDLTYMSTLGRPQGSTAHQEGLGGFEPGPGGFFPPYEAAFLARQLWLESM